MHLDHGTKKTTHLPGEKCRREKYIISCHTLKHDNLQQVTDNFFLKKKSIQAHVAYQKNNIGKNICFGAVSIKYFFFMSRISKLQETQVSSSLLSSFHLV